MALWFVFRLVFRFLRFLSLLFAFFLFTFWFLLTFLIPPMRRTSAFRPWPLCPSVLAVGPVTAFTPGSRQTSAQWPFQTSAPRPISASLSASGPPSFLTSAAGPLWSASFFTPASAMPFFTSWPFFFLAPAPGPLQPSPFPASASPPIPFRLSRPPLLFVWTTTILPPRSTMVIVTMAQSISPLRILVRVGFPSLWWCAKISISLPKFTVRIPEHVKEVAMFPSGALAPFVKSC